MYLFLYLYLITFVYIYPTRFVSNSNSNKNVVKMTSQSDSMDIRSKSIKVIVFMYLWICFGFNFFKYISGGSAGGVVLDVSVDQHVRLAGGRFWEKNTADWILVVDSCSLGLSATSQQYFYLRTNQPPASSTFLSERTSHQQPAATSQ
jgi:hypothetical protein